MTDTIGGKRSDQTPEFKTKAQKRLMAALNKLSGPEVSDLADLATGKTPIRHVYARTLAAEHGDYRYGTPEVRFVETLYEEYEQGSLVDLYFIEHDRDDDMMTHGQIVDCVNGMALVSSLWRTQYRPRAQPPPAPDRPGARQPNTSGATPDRKKEGEN